MYIMTKRGWRQLACKSEPAPSNDHMYSGPIPSLECLSFIRQSEKAHEEWVEMRNRVIG